MDSKQSRVEQVESYNSVITVEDHPVDGGFGSWLLEATSARPELLSRLIIKALDPSVRSMVAKQSSLNALGGLTAEALFRNPD